MLAEVPFPVAIRNQRYLTPLDQFDYPVIYGLSTPYIEQKINYEIYRLMLQVIYDLKRPDLVTYVSGAYEIKNNQRNVLSLTLIGLGDFRGAHPITVIKPLTVDILTGKTYKLKDLFKPDSDYLKVLSDLVYEQLEEQEVPLLGEFEGIRPDQDYYIADKNLIIYFQQYEIAPYAAGFPYATIPIYKLEELIPQDGLLQRMVSLS